MASKGSRTYKYIADPTTGDSVAEHIVVMERKLRRKLKKGETVEHIDGNEKNNAPSNLKILPASVNFREGGRRGAAKTNAQRGRKGRNRKA